MNCRTCGYPLWNLPTRACPECGEAFAPSEFTFVPGAVRYCCPGCDQAYYGTDARGHLAPREFNCVTCARPVTMDEMVVRPLLGGESAGSGGVVRATGEESREMPWLERERLGFLRAWFRTAGRAMTAPRQLMAAVPHSTPGSHAMGFAIMNQTAFAVISSVPGVLLVSLVGGGGPSVFSRITDLLVFGVGGYVAGIVGLIAWLPLTHLLLRLLRGATLPAARTWQALGYASAAGALSAVPLGCVSVAGVIWWVVAAIVMLGEGQRCPAWKATWAVLLAGCIAALPSMAISLYPVYSAIQAMSVRTTTTVGGASAATSIDPLSEALTEWSEFNGAWPDHAIELIEQDITPSEFTLDGLVDGEDRVAGGPSLSAFETAEDPGPLVAAARETLPGGLLAHRVGDWIFCTHGQQANTRLLRPPLWIAVSAPPDGARESMRRFDQRFSVINSHGTRLEMPLGAWSVMIEDQNRARAREGLPPLPTRYSEWCEAVTLGPDGSADPAGSTPAR